MTKTNLEKPFYRKLVPVFSTNRKGLKVLQRGQLDIPLNIAQPIFKEAGIIDELSMKVSKPDKKLWTTIFRDKNDPAIFILKFFESMGDFHDDIGEDASKAENDVIESLKQKIAITVSTPSTAKVQSGMDKDLKTNLEGLFADIAANVTATNSLKDQLSTLVVSAQQSIKSNNLVPFQLQFKNVVVLLGNILSANAKINDKIAAAKVNMS